MAQPQIDGQPPTISIQFFESKNVFFQPFKFGEVGEVPLAHTLPPGVICCTSQPRMHQEDRDIDFYTQWHSGELNSDSVMTFEAKNIPPESSKITTHEKFFLKVSSLIGENTAGQRTVEELYEEAHNYKLYLSSVEGEAVPRHYGVWLSCKEGDKLSFAVSIMQWGGLPYFTVENVIRNDSEDIKQAVLRAYHALHMTARVEHQTTSMAIHSLHVLYNEDLKKAFIVDFKNANFKHECGLRMPLQRYESMPSFVDFGCEELLWAIVSLRMITWP